MAPSFLKKTMVYLGLLDDEYDDYEDYEDRSPRGFPPVTRLDTRSPEAEEPEERPAATSPASVSRIRTLPREQRPRSTPTRPAPATRLGAAHARRGHPAKVQVVAPARFGDAKEIADCLKSNRPVIVNLQVGRAGPAAPDDRLLQRGHLRPER